MTQPIKFQLRDFTGKVVRSYIASPVGAPAPAEVKKPSHHVLVVDCSGSMYSLIAEVRNTILKALTLSEFNDPNQRISLISYSGKGDVRLHFARVTVEDVMKTASPYAKEISGLSARGLTCISQALDLASSAALVVPGETTCITLHSDGYANDRSPSDEKKLLETTVRRIAAAGGAFVNTIAYSYYSDFQLLSSLANLGSGTCVQARSAKDLYETIYNTQKLLAGNIAPALSLDIADANHVLYLSADKILGATESITVTGASADKPFEAFQIREIKGSDFDGYPARNADQSPVMYAFARYLLASGNLNDAKYALVSTRNETLLKRHGKALTNSALAAFAADLEAWATTVGLTGTYSEDYGLPKSLSVLDLCNLFAAEPDAVVIHIPTMLATYTKRGLKKIAGKRQDDGTLVLPETDLKAEDFGEWRSPNGFVISNGSATINMRFNLLAKLVKRGTTEVISEVEGVKLDLSTFRMYTVVGDGEVNMPKLRVRVVRKSLWAKLLAAGVVTGTFEPKTEIDIDLTERPVTAFDQSFAAFGSAIPKFLKLKVLSKFAEALVKAAKVSGAGTEFSAGQIAALKALDITPALYYSAATTNDYTDLKEAIAKGLVDYRTSFNVLFGTTDILHEKDLYSANDYIDRRFTLTVDGAAVEKPKAEHFFNPTAKWAVKTLSARTKLNAVDELTYPIMAALLGLGDKKEVTDLLPGLDFEQLKSEETVGNFAKIVDDAVETMYATWIRPVAFFVGASGLVPEALGTTMYSPEDFATKFGTKPGKNESEGTFFVTPDKATLIVFPVSKPFSTQALTADNLD